MMNVQLHQVWSRNICHHWNKMSHFCKSIRDDVDGVESVRFRQFTNEVRLDPLPWSIWSGDQLEFSMFTLILMFHMLAGMTTLYVSLDPVW
jgi:hypothetical protein